MNMRPASPFEAQSMARAALAIPKAQLRSALRAIAFADGYTATVEEVQNALRSLAAELRENGVDLRVWFG